MLAWVNPVVTTVGHELLACPRELHVPTFLRAWQGGSPT